MKQSLPVNTTAKLLVGADLDLTQECFAAFLATEDNATEVGVMNSWNWNPLAVWIRDQVTHVTQRSDWLVQVNSALVEVAGPADADPWHTVILASPRWLKDWWAEAKYHHRVRPEVTVRQAKSYLPRVND